ncbi:DUF4247 domain-containing protein [Actinomadura sp. 7K507]|uniref:DUF4247 domain-containing protein n=1 Tax=Actinomadura sp. 7K507 TaxID=2530365 RepID=UPI0010503A76|nr:DUF4247 domain-containing protein [Actinomadura sp. 7K507]TDC78216.1 DUF4247 domain-containing protein [Actinomadura sp. 7K507]
MKGPLIGAGLLASLGAITLLIATFAGKVSPRDDIADDYKKVSDRTYSSEKSPLVVAGEIVDENKTDERVYTPNGIYLRYYNAVVGVLPSAGGSRITVDDPDRGYARYHAAVGGTWGGPGGKAASFRGGGPGGGGK